MNEPIISPWLIYWAGRIEFIQVVCCVVGLVVTAFVVTAAMAVLTDDYEHDESVKALKILVCAALILDTLAVFLPTKTEIFAMYVAEKITPANIEATGEFTGKTVDMLIEKILKASIEEQIKEETAMLIDSFLRWEHIRTYGCQDPFYPDGENMNLVRNHIIYGKSRLEELCTDIPLPAQYYIPTPDEVDANYMAVNGKYYDYRIKKFAGSYPDITTKTPNDISNQQELF